jgi:hypothetical protein
MAQSDIELQTRPISIALKSLTTGLLTSKVVLAEGNSLLATVRSTREQPHRGPGSARVLGGSRDGQIKLQALAHRPGGSGLESALPCGASGVQTLAMD